MRIRTLVAALTGGTLALSGVVLGYPAGLASTTAQAAPPVLSMSGTLTERGTGMPRASAAASQQIASAAVTVDPGRDNARASVVLKGEPTSAQNSRLWLWVGKYTSGGTCQAIADYSTPTYGTPDPNHGWRRSGTTYTLDKTFDLYGGHILADSLDCAFAVVTELDDGNAFLDLLGGDLKPAHAQTKLQITSATLLGSKKLKLLPKEWITIEVAVKNIGAYETEGLVVTGTGNGVKVKKTKVAYALYSGSTATASVRVKLQKNRATSLKLAATAMATQAVTKTVQIKPAKAPKRIKDGNYRSADKHVTFRVKKGNLANFKVKAWTSCGHMPAYWNTYSLSTKKIPRSGIINVADTDPRYTAKLVGLAKGKKLTKGKFFYSGSGCYANVPFTAKRVG